MESNIQNQLHEEEILNNQQFQNEVDPSDDETLQTDLQDSEDYGELGDPEAEQAEEQELLQDEETGEDELDLGDADGSEGELEDEDEDLDA